ncbi:hypothetical protein MKW98_007996 [Papaver atlanticum]|uniref:F-box associated beta-propeller type 3 domain-containing protein n=1 Tax=Papaver atlanticum TaxID=357466 RepID=A0AAD4S8D0_9MAGN|nr:hypothetical protein MKW98_007996 [Papaver atlanticum]
MSSPPAEYIGNLFQVIVAFDVESEKFRSIPIPNFIVNQPDNDGDWEFGERFVHILEVDGHIALTDQVNRHVVKLWIFDEDGDNHEKIATNTTVGSRDGNWIEETIFMPFGPSRMQHYLFESITSTNQLAIGISMPTVNTTFFTFYLYERKNKTFMPVEINGMLTNQLYQMTNFRESLLPIPKQQQQQ